MDCEDSAITEFLAKVANKIRENILSDSQNSKTAKFLRKSIVSFIQYLAAEKVARTRLGGPPRRQINLENRRFAAAKEIANQRRRNYRF